MRETERQDSRNRNTGRYVTQDRLCGGVTYWDGGRGQNLGEESDAALHCKCYTLGTQMLTDAGEVRMGEIKVQAAQNSKGKGEGKWELIPTVQTPHCPLTEVMGATFHSKTVFSQNRVLIISCWM